METNIKGKMMQHKFSYYLYLTKGPFFRQSTEIQGQAVAFWQSWKVLVPSTLGITCVILVKITP